MDAEFGRYFASDPDCDAFVSEDLVSAVLVFLGFNHYEAIGDVPSPFTLGNEFSEGFLSFQFS